MSKQYKVLFIDDNPGDRLLIRDLLTKYDFHVSVAPTGTVGLRMAQEEKPDLILLDVLLPGISGIELCKKFKKDEITQSIPVIFYTANETPKDMIEYASYGAQNYLQKTMPPEELVAAIKAALV